MYNHPLRDIQVIYKVNGSVGGSADMAAWNYVTKKVNVFEIGCVLRDVRI